MSRTAPIERVDLTKCAGDCIECKQYAECSKAYNFWIEGADWTFWRDKLPEWDDPQTIEEWEASYKKTAGMTECGGVDGSWNPKATGYWRIDCDPDSVWANTSITMPPWYEDIARFVGGNHRTEPVWVEPIEEIE